MPTNLNLIWANLPVGFCWTNAQDFVTTLQSILSGTVSINGVIIQNGLPDNSDQDKLWVRTDNSGRPTQLYLFQGQWIWPHPEAPSSKMCRIWDGTEASLWAYDGGDGTDPSISAPTATTGAMWKRNPNFGTDDGATPFRMPVGIGKNLTTYDGNPAFVIAPGQTGGEERHTLSTSEMPAHTHNLPGTVGQVGPAQNGGDAAHMIPSGLASVTGPTGGGASHTNMPLYRGVIFAQRTARQFFTAS